MLDSEQYKTSKIEQNISQPGNVQIFVHH